MTKGPAVVWAQNFYTQHLVQGSYYFPSFSTFLNQLFDDFKDVASSDDSMYRLGRIVQKEDQTVEENNANFMRHVVRAEIPRPENDSQLLYNMYLKSLQKGILNRILSRPDPPRTLGEALKAALDENLKYRKVQRFHDPERTGEPRNRRRRHRLGR